MNLIYEANYKDLIAKQSKHFKSVKFVNLSISSLGVFSKECQCDKNDLLHILLWKKGLGSEGPATGEISYTLLRNPRKSTEMKSEIKKSREKSVNFQIRNHLKSRETSYYC